MASLVYKMRSKPENYKEVKFYLDSHPHIRSYCYYQKLDASKAVICDVWYIKLRMKQRASIWNLPEDLAYLKVYIPSTKRVFDFSKQYGKKKNFASFTLLTHQDDRNSNNLDECIQAYLMRASFKDNNQKKLYQLVKEAKFNKDYVMLFQLISKLPKYYNIQKNLELIAELQNTDEHAEESNLL
jgi:hypothetical protein